MIKVYMIYLKYNMELYAVTDEPKYYHEFITQRNSKLFKVKKVRMDEDEYKKFVHKNYKLKLCESLLYDGKRDASIVDTVYEEDSLNYITNTIENRINRIRGNLVGILNEKYLKVITDVTTLIIPEDEFIQINTFELFYYLFRYTFVNVTKAEVTSEALNNIITKE